MPHYGNIVIFLASSVKYARPQEGHLAVVKVLLTESQINAGAVNLRGQNPLHVLANYPKDNAAAIAEVFLEAMPDYDLNRVDVEGNSGKRGWER